MSPLIHPLFYVQYPRIHTTFRRGKVFTLGKNPSPDAHTATEVSNLIQDPSIDQNPQDMAKALVMRFIVRWSVICTKVDISGI